MSKNPIPEDMLLIGKMMGRAPLDLSLSSLRKNVSDIAKGVAKVDDMGERSTGSEMAMEVIVLGLAEAIVEFDGGHGLRGVFAKALGRQTVPEPTVESIKAMFYDALKDSRLAGKLGGAA